MSSCHSSTNPAFTIVELLVVIVVIGILAAITIVSYAGISSRASAASLQSDLTNAMTQLKLDQVTNSSFPTTLALANGGKGIPASSGTTYTYAISNTTIPQTFCITATKNNINYNITQDGNSQPGICPVLNLDAGNMSSYPGTGTTWTDLSGNGNSGTLNGGVAYSSGNGGVLVFDGISGGTVSVLNNFEMLSNYTISFWAKNNVASKMPIASGVSTSFYWYGDNSWRYTHGGTGAEYYYPKSVNIPYGTWGNFCVSYNGSNVSIYRNGVFEGSQATTGTVDFSNGFMLGNWNGGVGYMFNGSISVVSIYNRALSASDIQQNFNALRGRYGL